MKLMATGLKAIVAIALTGAALSAVAASPGYDRDHRYQHRHHRVMHATVYNNHRLNTRRRVEPLRDVRRDDNRAEIVVRP